MKIAREKSLWDWIAVLVILFVTVGGATYYLVFYTPKDSIELYQKVAFADDFDKVRKIMAEGYEDNFKEKDFEFLNSLESTPERIRQLTLFEYEDRTFVFDTTLGTAKLKVFAVEELPQDVREYFLQIAP